MHNPCSRRAFFGQAPAGAATVLWGATPPPRAWIILERNWQYNDEYTYADGELAHSILYYHRTNAEAACQALNDKFYADQTPDEFYLDWETYFPNGLPPGKSLDEITWDDVKTSDCWVEAFLLQELTVPGDTLHE